MGAWVGVDTRVCVCECIGVRACVRACVCVQASVLSVRAVPATQNLHHASQESRMSHHHHHASWPQHHHVFLLAPHQWRLCCCYCCFHSYADQRVPARLSHALHVCEIQFSWFQSKVINWAYMGKYISRFCFFLLLSKIACMACQSMLGSNFFWDM